MVRSDGGRGVWPPTSKMLPTPTPPILYTPSIVAHYRGQLVGIFKVFGLKGPPILGAAVLATRYAAVLDYPMG